MTAKALPPSPSTSRHSSRFTLGDGSPTKWRSLLLGCVVIQIGATVAFPDQRWSMAVGLALIIFCCAAITFRIRPDRRVEQWRWHVVTIGFVFWGLGFVAIAYQDNFLDSLELMNSMAAVLRQLCFIVVLMPSTGGEDARIFRALDVGQALVFAVLLGVLTWHPLVATLEVHVDMRFVKIGYTTLFALSVLSYFTQEDQHCKRLIRNIAILFALYAIASSAAIFIHQNYVVGDNSLIWLLGDLSFIIFFALSLRADHTPLDTEATVRPMNRRHLSPLFVAVMILLLAVEIGKSNIWLGMTAGALGLLIYAARTTLLLDHYLAVRDQKILAEQTHSRLLVDMIHEIRAPLGSVVLNASMLKNRDGLPQERAAWIDQIGLGGARVTTMLNDVLEIERIDAGLIGPKLSSCDVAAAISASIAVVEAQALTADIVLQVENNGDGNAWADVTMLERVVINLLTNAIRFTPAGGRILVTIAANDPQTLTVCVTDDGVGISDAAQATLFDRFSHIGAPLHGQKGSGLGLAICRGLMLLMGGSIAIDSHPGEGTTATILIPRYSSPA